MVADHSKLLMHLNGQCAACFGTWWYFVCYIILYLSLRNPKPMNPNEYEVLSFFSFLLNLGLSVRLFSSSRKAPLGTHKIAISRRRQSFECNLSLVSRGNQSVRETDWMDKQFLLNQTIKFPGSIPSLWRGIENDHTSFLRILMMMVDSLILLSPNHWVIYAHSL